MVKAKVSKTSKKSKKSDKNIEKQANSSEILEEITQNIIATGDYSINDMILPLVKNLMINSSNLTHTAMIIITYDREKALNIKKVINLTIQDQDLRVNLAIRGNSSESESKKLEKNNGVIISTAEKLFFHIENTRQFNHKQVKFLIIDGLDIIIKNGNLQTLEKIFEKLDSENLIFRVLAYEKIEFSSTFFNNILSKTKILENIIESDTSNLIQKYVKVDSDKKFLLLYTFLFKNQTKKVVVLFSCSAEIKFFKKLLALLGIKIFSSNMKNSIEKNREVYLKFAEENSGILLSTIVNSSELSKNQTDYVIFYDTPKIEEYKKFTSLVKLENSKIIFFTDESNKNLIENLSVSELKFTSNKLINIQAKVEKLVERDYSLHKAAREGYRNYILSVSRKDYHKVAKSFGLNQAFLVNGLKD